MNKQTLITFAATRAGLTKADTTRALDAVLEIITEELVAGGDVRLTGFGIFNVRKRSAREGRNPWTGEKIPIPEMRIPGFKASKQLSEQVKGTVEKG
jgi:DNA-binding protein HU-beta